MPRTEPLSLGKKHKTGKKMPSSSGKQSDSSATKAIEVEFDEDLPSYDDVHETSGKKTSGSSGKKSDAAPGKKSGSSGQKSGSSGKQVIELTLDDEDLPSYDDAMASGPRIFEARGDSDFHQFHHTSERLICCLGHRTKDINAAACMHKSLLRQTTCGHPRCNDCRISFYDHFQLAVVGDIGVRTTACLPVGRYPGADALETQVERAYFREHERNKHKEDGHKKNGHKKKHYSS